jgi:hypothetical protein
MPIVSAAPKKFQVPSAINARTAVSDSQNEPSAPVCLNLHLLVQSSFANPCPKTVTGLRNSDGTFPLRPAERVGCNLYVNPSLMEPTDRPAVQMSKDWADDRTEGSMTPPYSTNWPTIREIPEAPCVPSAVSLIQYVFSDAELPALASFDRTKIPKLLPITVMLILPVGTPFDFLIDDIATASMENVSDNVPALVPNVITKDLELCMPPENLDEIELSEIQVVACEEVIPLFICKVGKINPRFLPMTELICPRTWEFVKNC